MSGEKLLQDRLQQQSGGFSGLLSLIPAKMYYGEDNTDQWNKKKQTKAEAKAAKRAKLDPDSERNRNAKEVMDERAKNKRKAREMEQEDDAEDSDDNAQDGGDMTEAIDGIDAEKPGEGLTKAAESNKKQKRDETNDDEDSDNDNEEDWEDEQDEDGEDDGETTKLSKKQEKKAAKTLKRKEKRAEKKAKKSDADDKTTSAPEAPAPAKKEKKEKKPKKEATPQPEPASADEEEDEQPKPTKAALDFSGLEDDGTSPPSDAPSPTFDTTAPNGTSASTSTSVSSVASSSKPKHIKIPTDTSALKARLEAKIAALRAARKADGPDGKPIRTRQELIESRRAKEAQRKAHKQELRAAAKIEEQRKREEALASNSPSVMSPAVERADSPGGFAFGRVAFGDGTQLSHDLSYVLNNRGESAAAGGPPKKKKGPSDPKTALLKVQAQKKRLAELDPEKRADISSKDAWLTMRRRAEGERKIKDDEAALKKTIKRKDAAKKKSEKAWKERQDGVKMAQKQKQKKREDNLRERKETKMLGKAGKMKKKGGGGGAKKKGGRPGFEGGGFGGRKK